MYRNCIFCSALLGANEAVESFPVGTQSAFDSWKGRLWAVCPRCARWNLAPIEERWEPVEQAEQRFRDAALRVQSENVGLARLPDGTRLIRIGKALPGELAAWRYGTQLLRRRNRLILGFAGVAGIAAAATVMPVVALFGSTATLQAYLLLRDWRVVHRLRDVTGAPVLVRRWHVGGMSVSPTTDGDVQVHIRDLRVRTRLLGMNFPRPDSFALALEMALTEESERRALEGELAALEAAWREAEEIAAIADSLPDRIQLPRWLRR